MTVYWEEGKLPQDKPIKTKKMSIPQGIDSITIPAITDLDSHWFGIQIDKTKFKVILEDETEDSVYLKIELRKDYNLTPDKKLSDVLYE